MEALLFCGQFAITEVVVFLQAICAIDLAAFVTLGSQNMNLGLDQSITVGVRTIDLNNESVKYLVLVIVSYDIIHIFGNLFEHKLLISVEHVFGDQFLDKRLVG